MSQNDRLFQLLGELDDEELLHLWEHSLGKSPKQDDFGGGVRAWRIARISQEWRATQNKPLEGLIRERAEVSWKQILIAAADRLTPGFKGSHYSADDPCSEEDLECAVLDLYDERIGPEWNDLTPDARKIIATGGYPPSGNLILDKLAELIAFLWKDRSLAATLMLLTCHERRRLIRIKLDQVAE